MTYSQQYLAIEDRRFHIDNHFFYDWAEHHSVDDFSRKLWTCLKSGFGYMENVLINRSWFRQLSEGDKALIVDSLTLNGLTDIIPTL